MPSPSTRRGFLTSSLAAASAIAAAGTSLNPSAPLSTFNYGDVRFPPGPLQRQFDENLRLVLNLNEGSLLRPFRLREGMPAPGQELGGWYDTYAFAPAATFGQWVSALARFYAINGDAAAKAKLDRLVNGYAATIHPAGKFYIDNRFPSYTYDKLVLALVDAHRYAGKSEALRILAQTTAVARPYLPPAAIPRTETPVNHNEDLTQHCWDESYTLPENLFIAQDVTGDRTYGALARRFLYTEFYNALAQNENALPGKHAYSHVNCLSSAAKAFLVTNDQSYLRAARNGLTMVAAQSFATGGWGPDEHFFAPGSGTLGNSLSKMHASFETPCGSYAHFKLTRYLLQITRDSQYGDSMERVLYNTVLGAKPIQEDGRAFYYSDYTFGAAKGFHPDRWPCCSGTLPQMAADYHISAYLRSERGVYVNLYVPSTLAWQMGGKLVSVKQTTAYPYASSILIEITAPPTSPYSVFLRIPQWAGGAVVSVNGGPPAQPSPGAFFEVRRSWKAGDRVELELPLKLRTEAVDAQHPTTLALLQGPLVLFRLQTESPAASSSLSAADLLTAAQTASGSPTWKLRNRPEQFTSWTEIKDQRYSAYTPTSGSA